MLLEQGDKVHIMTRRKFNDDLRRHFAGKVISCGEAAVKAKGYVFVLDPRENRYIKQPELRTRIFSLVDAGNIINVIPSGTDIEEISYKLSADNILVVTDGGGFALNVNEFGTRF
ncbi:hypothetical protein ACFL5V_06825 [Fibrobacterota bacterium]